MNITIDETTLSLSVVSSVELAVSEDDAISIDLSADDSDQVALAVEDGEELSLSVGETATIVSNPYTGSYQWTPSTSTQTIEINGLTATADITINPIPSNYGLITWNGSQLTVS